MGDWGDWCDDNRRMNEERRRDRARRGKPDRRWHREDSGPAILGLVIAWFSVYGVFGGVAWATEDVLVGAVVALAYATGLTIYLGAVWR